MDVLQGYVHHQAGFQSLLHLERMRSDRSGIPFALAVFRFESADSSDEAATFADTIRSSARATDHVGWMQHDSVGIILWNTATQGAWHFIDKTLPTAEVQPDCCDVYVYPAGAAEAIHRPDQTRPTDTSSKSPPTTAAVAAVENAAGTATLAPPQTQTESHVRIERNLELTEQLLSELLTQRETAQTPARSTQPLEVLFERPMPWWKRSLDIVGAAGGLILLSPLFAGVALAIKLTSPGPVFFSQQRSGRGGRPFPMYKFRSMVVDAEAMKQELMQQNEQDGPAFKIENDPRITRIGHLIRKSSIDELPQLWNVLRGDMSLVGPRPLPCAETEGCAPWQRRRLEATPGLTCIWQVQDRRTKIPFADWARMDIRYIGRRTLKQDLLLVWKTFGSIFGRKGS